MTSEIQDFDTPRAWFWLYWFIPCLCVLVALPEMMSGNYLPKSAWAALSIGVGFFLTTFRQKTYKTVTPLGIIWFIYLSWILLSLTWSPSPRAGIERWLMFLIPTFAYLLAAKTCFWKSETFWIAFSSLIFLIGLVGLLQYAIPDFPLNSWYQGTAVPRSTMGQRNYASMYFMITWPFLLILWYRFKGLKSILPLFALTITLAFLFLAKTRGAWVGSIGAIILLLGFGGAKIAIRDPRKTIILLLILSGGLVMSYLLRPTAEVEELMGNKREFKKTVFSFLNPKQRLDYWKPCLGVTPFWTGAGFGNFPILATPDLKDGTVKTLNWEVHNDYLQSFVDLGIVGLGLFSCFCLLLLRIAWLKRKTEWGLPAGAAVVSLLLMQFTTFTSEKISSLIWIAGVIAILNTPRKEEPYLFSFSLPPWIGKFISLILSAVSILLGVAIILTIRGDYALRRSLEASAKTLDIQEKINQENDPEQINILTATCSQMRQKAILLIEEAHDDYLPIMFYDANMRHIYLHQLSEFYLKLNALYQAEWISHLALELHPYDRSCLGILAYCTLKEGRFKEAEALLSRGFKIFGPNPYIPFFPLKLAKLLDAKKQHDQANAIREKLNSYLVKYPQNPLPNDWSIVASPVSRLSWQEPSLETSYDLYLWQIGENEPEKPLFSKLEQKSIELDPPLKEATVYLWRVISRGRFSDQTGPIWSFRISSP